jgi:hypothetical protein
VVKFLIDECLSLDLVDLAWERGFTQSSHVVWLGKAGWKDWELKPFILDGDLTFVTRDSVDFRGPAEHPGTKGQYADVALHAGLVCMNGPAGMNLELQCELFSIALDEIGNVDQLVNEVIEVDLETPEAEVTIRRYTIPD